MELLFWVIVITWMVNRTVVDGLYALQGKPNPRYELAKAKAAAASKPAPVPARYGTRQWWDDLYCDALAANTRWRRQRRQSKTIDTAIDDMVEAVREAPQPARKPQPAAVSHGPTSSVVHEDDHTYCLTPGCPTCLRDSYGWTCHRCGTNQAGYRTQAQARADGERHTCPGKSTDRQPEDTDRPVAAVIALFPNAKEIVMNGSDTNGLSAAMAFAQAAAEAHESFATAGSEGYTGALVRFEVGEECISLAQQAQEASAIAAAKWAAHLESLTRQQTVKEAYQSVPDAGNKTFLLNG